MNNTICKFCDGRGYYELTARVECGHCRGTGITPPMTQDNKEQLPETYEFEKYPKLTEYIREYASFGHFSSWTGFIEELNNCLKQSAFDKKEVASKFLKFIGSNNWYVNEDGSVWEDAYTGLPTTRTVPLDEINEKFEIYLQTI